MDRAQKLADTNNAIRLEFSRVTDVSAEGCVLLLDTFKKLQRRDCDMILVGANDFAKKIRGILEVGRRDDTEAPWLLLLEVLQLLNHQQEFEEASIDYCVTFEVSPPAFVAPKSHITSVLEDTSAPAAPDNVFMMPTVVDSKTNLIDAISKFSKQHNPAILDCHRLTRVDFSAASQLLTGLAPMVSDTCQIELHNVNQLVNALFNVMGLREVVRIYPRKQ